jgi:hypothetical protein
MAVFLRRLMRIGKLPDDLRTELGAEGIVYLAEYVAVTVRFTGAVPGLRSAGGSIHSDAGAVAFTRQRALATLSSLPNVAARVVDHPWAAPQAGPLQVEISETGMQLDLDVGRVDPSFHGHLSMHYKDQIPAEVLSRLPARSLACDVTPEFVYRAVGVRPKDV